MKRLKTAIIIMAAVLVAALGIFLIATKQNSDKLSKESEEADKLILFDFDSDSIDKVEINNESGRYLMIYNESSGWELSEADKELELNPASVESITSNMSDLTAEKILNDSDSSKYGFDDPIKISAFSGDTEYTLLIGDATPTYENFYVMKENDENIYLIDYTTGSYLCATRDFLKQGYILNCGSSDITQFCLWEGAEKDENILFSMTKSGGAWIMDKPYQDSSVYNTQITLFLDDAIRDEIFEFIQEDCKESDYAKYGFDDPQYVFEATYTDGYTKVIFGDYTNNENEMYALFTETGQVVTVVSNEIALLSYDTMDMMNTSVYSANISDVSEIEITMPDVSVTLEITSDDDSYIYSVDGKELTTDEEREAFASFYNSFNNAYFESIENDDKPSGDAEITIKYTLTNNIVKEIEYIPVPGDDSNTYWAINTGEYTGFVVRKKVIAGIENMYKELMQTVAEAES